MGLKRAGQGVLRWGLWLLLGWVFVRGVVSLLPEAPAQAAEPQAQADVAVESAALRALPEMFAREYLSWTPGGAEERAARLKPYLAPGLDRNAGWSPPSEDAGQQVEQTWAYGVKQVSPTRWQVTVAARVVPLRDQATPQTIFLAVPVGKVEGGWIVYDYPSLVPAPEPAAFGEPLYYGQEVTDEDGRAKALLTDFFKAYLGGGDVTYYLAPGVQVRTVRAGWTFDQVTGLKLLTNDDGRWALADVAARDAGSGARFVYRYTVKLTDRDGRWHIAELLQKGD